MKIISGGQSGADIGGLTAALEWRRLGHELEVGGVAPPQFITEHRPYNGRGDQAAHDRLVAIMKEAGVKAHPYWVKGGQFDSREDIEIVQAIEATRPGQRRSQHDPRTAINVRDADATVLFGGLRGGTLHTKQLAEYFGKPVLVDPTPEVLASFIRDQGVEVLNVAGRRESQVPGNEERTHQTVLRALELLDGSSPTASVVQGSGVHPLAAMPEQPAAAVNPTGQQQADAVQLDLWEKGKRFAGDAWPYLAAAGGAGLVGYAVADLMDQGVSAPGGARGL
jgi:hypothetical protein